ncbi:MAG: hypothetical protein ACF8MJ_02525 [Phycisphaerales bacterium JB050]
MTEKPRRSDISSDRAFMAECAHAQDALMQSYRNFHITFQSILLAAGVGLSILPLTMPSYPSLSTRSIISFSLLVAICMLHVYTNKNFKAIVKDRGKNVNHWQNSIIVLEQTLGPARRHYTRFKYEQQLRRSGTHKSLVDLDHMMSAGISDEATESLLSGEKHHMRNIIDDQLFFWIGVVWALLVGSNALSIIVGAVRHLSGS